MQELREIGVKRENEIDYPPNIGDEAVADLKRAPKVEKGRKYWRNVAEKTKKR